MNDKLKKIMIIVMAIGILLVFVLFLVSSCDKKYIPETLQTKILESTQEYYKNNKEELPSKDSVLTLSLNDLVSKGIIKELNKIIEKNTSCTGNITIENNNNYYMYSPSLDCTDGINTYKTKNLRETLLNDVVTSGNGLYSIGNSYYFRGDIVNNYIIFDGVLWRITKINEDNSIRLIEAGRRDSVVWDDRYNTDRLDTSGFNDYVHENINSRIKDELENLYNSNSLISEKGKGYIKPTNLCVGKRNEEEINNDGSIECSNTINNQYFGLIQLNEFLIASLDNNCQKSTSIECSNYNYLSSFQNSYWTLTANGENNYQVYKVYRRVSLTNASNNGMARVVINISENTNVLGSGTENDPYKVIGTKTELNEK